MIQTLLRHATIVSGATNIGLSQYGPSTLSNGLNYIIASTDGVASNLRIDRTVAPGGVTSSTFELYKNAVATGLIVTIGSASTGGQDIVNTVSYVENDRLHLEHTVAGGTPATCDVDWSIDLDSDDTVSSWYGGNYGVIGTDFADVFGHEVSNTRATVERPIAYPGTITQMHVGSNIFAIAAGTGLDVYLYLNGVKQDGTGGTVDTLTAIGPSAPGTSVSSSFSLPVVRGDYICHGTERTGVPNTYMSISIRFEADAAGVHLIAARGGGDPSSSAARDHSLLGNSSIWSAAAAAVSNLKCGITPVGAAYLILDCTVDPGTGNTRTFEVFKNGSAPSGGPVGIISSGALRIDDQVGTVDFATGDDITLQHTPASSPTVSGTEYWGLVLYDVGIGGPIPPWPIPDPGGEIPPINAPPADALPLKPKLFIHLTLPNANEYCFAEIPLSDAGATPMPIGGYKPAKLMIVSDIERELSPSGYKGSSWSFTIADLEPLREWREIAITETIEGAVAVLYAIDDDVRLAGGQPYCCAVGIVVHHEGALNSIQYKFDVEDALGVRLTNIASDPKVPAHPLLTLDFPELDPEMDGKFPHVAIGKLVTGNGTAPGRLIATNVNLLAALGGPDLNVDVYLHSKFAVGLAPAYYYTMSTWGPEELVTPGWFNRPTPNKATGLYYVVAVAGTTGTSEPTWPTVIGNTVADGSVTWRAHATDNPDLRFLIPVEAYSVGIIASSFMPNFDVATNQPNQYLDHNGHRYGVVTLILHDFIYAKAIRDKRMFIVADVYGVTPNADGSGLYVSSHEGAIQWITVIMLFSESTGTTYATMPQINGYDIFNAQSLTDAKAVAAAALSGGFVSGFMLGRGGSQQSGFTLYQEILEGGDLELGPNRHGQAMFARENPAATAVLQLNELHHFESFNISTNSTENKNWMQARFGWRYVPELTQSGSSGQPLPITMQRNTQWESGTRIVQDTTAQGNVGRIKRVNFDNYATVDSPTALAVMQRKFARHLGPSATRDGQKVFVATGGWGMLGLGAVQLELNSVIGLTSGLGFGSSGFVTKTGRITKVRLSPQSGKITYYGPVLYPYIATVAE